MRQQTVSVEQLERMRNYAVYSKDGEKIGPLEDLYVDEQSQRPEWISLGTGFFGTKRVLVPFEGASVSGDEVTVPYTKDQVQDAPDIDSDVIDAETERALYAYYSRGGRAETDDLAETATMKSRLQCIECRKRLSNEHEAGWQAYLVCDPDIEGEEEEIVIYCPACARREFGPFASEAS
jgi:sporulation protein YlmC with PRC-barrel domain